MAESSEDNSAIPYKAKTLLIEDAWPWRFVERPILSFVELHKSGDEKPARKADSHPSLDMLDWKSGHLLAEGSSPAAGVLASIHRAWTKTTIPAYADEALAVADAVIEHEKGRALNQWLPLLFELEGFASHLTYTKDLRIFSSGFFANNWLEVGLLELSQFRATELCVRERLLDEIVNLTTRGFAPVVINEFRCVADGNHRLTAAWLWNLLKQCHDLKWDVGDDDFQRAVADFAGRHARGMGAVVLHEVLDHLGAFLTTRGLRSRLMGEIRPALSRFRVLGELPVVLLPEYLSGAVLKDPYDRGEATIRIEPSVYEFIQQVPDAVLPARASYHFTDCVLLPWFSVLSPADGTCSIRLRRKMGRRPPVRRFRGRGQEVVAETGLARTGSWRG